MRRRHPAQKSCIRLASIGFPPLHQVKSSPGMLFHCATSNSNPDLTHALTACAGRRYSLSLRRGQTATTEAPKAIDGTGS
jgi:hypothetical protein